MSASRIELDVDQNEHDFVEFVCWTRGPSAKRAPFVVEELLVQVRKMQVSERSD